MNKVRRRAPLTAMGLVGLAMGLWGDMKAAHTAPEKAEPAFSQAQPIASALATFAIEMLLYGLPLALAWWIFCRYHYRLPTEIGSKFNGHATTQQDRFFAMYWGLGNACLLAGLAAYWLVR